MFQALLFVFAFFASIKCFPAYTDSTCDGQWKMIWSDEFEGKEIDLTKWTHEIGKFYNNELEFYTSNKENSFVEDGALVIQALNHSRNYTSARLITAGKFVTHYGRIEARAKLPYGQGMWPAFWMLGDKGGWPECGEIDIMEYVGFHPTHVFSALHATNFDTIDNFTDTKGFFNDFHIFTLYWDPGRIRFAVNGVIFAEKRAEDAKTMRGSWPFDRDDFNAFIILNLAVGGDWPGNPNASTQFPQRFVFDYVRVYKCLP